MSASLGLAACAHAPIASGPGESEVSDPVFANETRPEAKARTDYLMPGGASTVISTQSERRMNILNHVSQSPYGNWYTAVVAVRPMEGIGTGNINEETGATEIVCGTKASTLGGFLNLIGVKRSGSAVLLTQLHYDGTPIGAKLPLITITKNKQRCAFKVTEAELTAPVKMSGADRLTLTYEIKYAVNNKSDFSQILGLATSIATAGSQNATDGFAGALTDIATHKIDTQVNNLLSKFDKVKDIAFTTQLPMGAADATWNYDRIIISTAQPVATGWNVSFDNLPDSAVTMELKLEYHESAFISCGQGFIRKASDGGCQYSNVDQILDRKFIRDGRPLSLEELAKTQTDLGAAGLAGLLEKANEKPKKENAFNDREKYAPRREAIEAACQQLKDSDDFNGLNILDKVLARYALLAKYTDYEENDHVRSQICISDKEKDDFLDLNPNYYRLEPPALTPKILAINSASFVATELGKGPVGKNALFADNDATLEVRLAPLVTAGDGSDLRAPPITQGADAATMLEDIKFLDGQFCPRPGADQFGKETGTLIGFWHLVRDEKSGGYRESLDPPDESATWIEKRYHGAFAIPVVIEMAGNEPPRISKFTIPASPEGYYRLLGLKIPGDPWEVCNQSSKADRNGVKTLKSIIVSGQAG